MLQYIMDYVCTVKYRLILDLMKQSYEASLGIHRFGRKRARCRLLDSSQRPTALSKAHMMTMKDLHSCATSLWVSHPSQTNLLNTVWSNWGGGWGVHSRSSRRVVNGLPKKRTRWESTLASDNQITEIKLGVHQKVKRLRSCRDSHIHPLFIPKRPT